MSSKVRSSNGSTARNACLGAGDAIFIAPGTVHATFNVGKSDARVVVVFSPCVGDAFEAVDVSGEAPWQGLRV